MENERLTNIPDFFGELDGGVFETKLSAALNEVALGVLNNGSKGKVQVTFDFSRLSNSVDEKRVGISHKLTFVKPTNRGKIAEEDTTETPMYVNRGGKLTVLQEDQGQLFTLAGDADAKLRGAK